MEVFVSLVRFRNAGVFNSGIYRVHLKLTSRSGIHQDQIAVVTYHESTPKYSCRGRALSEKPLAETREVYPANGGVYSSPFQIDYEEEDVEHGESVLFHVNASAPQLISTEACKLEVALEFKSKTGYVQVNPQVVDLPGERYGLNDSCVLLFSDPNHGCAILELIVLSASLQVILNENSTSSQKLSLIDQVFPSMVTDASYQTVDVLKSNFERKLVSFFGPFKSSLAMLESIAQSVDLSPASVSFIPNRTTEEGTKSNDESIEEMCKRYETIEAGEAPKRVLLFNAICRKYMREPQIFCEEMKLRWKQRARDLVGELFVREKMPLEQLLQPQDAAKRAKEYRAVAEKLRTAPRFTDWDASARPLSGSHTFIDDAGRPVVFEQRYDRNAITTTTKQPLTMEHPTSENGKLAADLASENVASTDGVHLVVLVHGFMGSKWDFRGFILAMTMLDLPGIRCKPIESNINSSEWPLEDQGVNVAGEIVAYCKGKNITKLSFVAYSMGAIVTRMALNQPCMRQFDDKLHAFISIAGPHLGTLGSDSSIVGFGQWAFIKWKKVKSLEQLALQDDTLLQLNMDSKVLSLFTQIALVSSADDTYVPAFSARMELPIGNKSPVVAQMQRSLVESVLSKVDKLSIIEMAFEFGSRRSAKARLDAIIGRAAHIHVLDSLPLSLALVLIFAHEWFL